MDKGTMDIDATDKKRLMNATALNKMVDILLPTLLNALYLKNRIN